MKELLFEDEDFESVYKNDEKAEDKKEKVEEPKDKEEKDGEPEGKVTLSDIASYLYAFGNDVRILHLYTTGTEFIPYHEMLNDLYSIVFDAFDSCAEMAISYGEKIKNPSLLPETWKPLGGEKFTPEKICKEVNDRGNRILGTITSIKEYESFTQSRVDDFAAEIDKLVNYIFKQSSK